MQSLDENGTAEEGSNDVRLVCLGTKECVPLCASEFSLENVSEKKNVGKNERGVGGTAEDEKGNGEGSMAPLVLNFDGVVLRMLAVVEPVLIKAFFFRRKMAEFF